MLSRREDADAAVGLAGTVGNASNAICRPTLSRATGMASHPTGPDSNTGDQQFQIEIIYSPFPDPALAWRKAARTHALARSAAWMPDNIKDCWLH